jgi:hypothetical protein
MQKPTDADEFMPDAAALAAIEASIADYNARRIATLRRGMLQVGGVLAAAAVSMAALLFWGRDLGKSAGMLLFTVGPMLWCLAVWYGVIRAWRPVTELRLGLRYQIIPALFGGFIDRLKYQPGWEPGLLQALKHLRLQDFTTAETDDQLSGVHDGMSFTLVEARLHTGSGKSRRLAFGGLVLHVILDRDYPGILAIGRRQEENWLAALANALFPGEDQAVYLGDDHLDRTYVVRTDNPDAAAPAIATTIVPTLRFLLRSWPGAGVRLALRRRECFLMLPGDRDFFALPGIRDPLHYEAHVRPMVHQMRLLLAIGQLLRKL